MHSPFPSLVLLRRTENAVEDMAKPYPRFEETAPDDRRVGGEILRIDRYCPLGFAYLEGGIISGILTGGADLHAVFDVRRNRNLVRLIRPGNHCLLYTSPSPRDRQKSRMPSSA